MAVGSEEGERKGGGGKRYVKTVVGRKGNSYVCLCTRCARRATCRKQAKGSFVDWGLLLLLLIRPPPCHTYKLIKTLFLLVVFCALVVSPTTTYRYLDITDVCVGVWAGNPMPLPLTPVEEHPFVEKLLGIRVG